MKKLLEYNVKIDRDDCYLNTSGMKNCHGLTKTMLVNVLFGELKRGSLALTLAVLNSTMVPVALTVTWMMT